MISTRLGPVSSPSWWTPRWEPLPWTRRLASATRYGAADHQALARVRTSDINGDDRRYLVVEFRIDRLDLSPGDIVVDPWGRTWGNVAFTGADVVEIVESPPGGLRPPDPLITRALTWPCY